MPRVSLAVPLFLLLGLLLPGFAAAQPSPQADLGLQVSLVNQVSIGDSFLAFGYLRNHGPDTAQNVVLTTSAGRFAQTNSCVADDAGRCTLENLPAGADVSFQIHLDREVAGPVGVDVAVTSATRDPNPANDRFRGTVTFVLATELSFHVSGGTADPGGPVEYESYLTNFGPIAATNVRFTFRLPDGWTFERSLSDELQCSAADGNVQCTIARVEGRDTLRSKFVLRAAATPNGSTYQTIPITLTADHGVLTRDNRVLAELKTQLATIVYRHIAVTTAGDEGEGSLRHAMIVANAECAITSPPCKIVFDVTGAGSHVTIQPLTPLPTIRTSLTIDGATQTARHGDTNPAGPEVEINGAHLTAGNGLEVVNAGTSFELRNVVLNGFPGSGVAIRSPGQWRLITGNYIGTDVTGQRAVPNGRGVTNDIDLDNFETSQMAYLRLIGNVISGNRRSGFFAVNGYDIGLFDNRIGTTAGDRPAPLGNGASGIYLGTAASAVVIQRNIIAFNAESGIATAKPVGYVAIRANSIFDNGLLGIDLGLDLVTKNPEPGKAGAFPRYPVLTLARYDAATNTTRIEGDVGTSWTPPVAAVELFANDTPGLDGHGQGELYLGRPALRESRFALDYHGDLRGRFITATFTMPNNYYPEALPLLTSEFSESLRVDGDAAAPIDPAAVVPRGADLAVSGTFSPFQFRAGTNGRIHLVVGSIGPETANDVMVDVTTDGGRLQPMISRCTEIANGLRCRVTNSTLDLELEAPTGPDKVTIHARATTSTFDPDPSNNETTLEIPVSSQPVLSVRVTTPGATDPGGTATYTYYASHESVVEAHDVEIRVRRPEDWTLVSGPSGKWSCTSEGSEIVCRTASIEGGTTESFSYTLRAPESEFGLSRITEPVRLSTAGNDDYYPSIWVIYEIFRVIPVTTTADDGPGSLRAAINRANSECAPDRRYGCKITFAIGSGNATISPLTPLPAIDARVTIDGNTRVELNGSQQATGNGLEIVSTGLCVVRGLTITRFPGNGIAVRTLGRGDYGDRRMITGNHIAGNGARGITIETANDYWTGLDITGNVIDGNARAGVFVASGADVRISGNRIDHNGASGVYLGIAEGIDIEGNEIAHNLHAGIGSDRAAAWNTIRGNATFDNGGLGVDHGLDLVTFNDADDRIEMLPQFPIITSAVWDESAKVTRIEGRAERSGHMLLGVIVELFASDTADGTGFGEGQRSLGEISLPGAETEQSFSFEVAEDLRGKFITATLSRRGPDGLREHWTSEISQAVPVP